RLADGTMQDLAAFAKPEGSLTWDRHGRLYASDGEKVFVIGRPGDKPIVLAEGFKGGHGICLGPSGKEILVADVLAGTVTALPAQIPGAPVDERPIAIEAAPAFPNLQWTDWKPTTDSGKQVPLRPIVLTHAGDGSNRVFVATQHGVIHAF